MKCVIPVKAGIQLLRDVLVPGVDPGHDPGFAGVTTREILSGILKKKAR